MFRKRQPKASSFEERLEALRASGFETLPEAGGRVQVRRAGCAAIIDSGPRIERAGWLVGGEIAELVDGGYQKFWRAGGRNVPALAGQLEALHEFEGTMLFVSHDRTFLRGLGSKVLELGGELIAQGGRQVGHLVEGGGVFLEEPLPHLPRPIYSFR